MKIEQFLFFSNIGNYFNLMVRFVLKQFFNYQVFFEIHGNQKSCVTFWWSAELGTVTSSFATAKLYNTALTLHPLFQINRVITPENMKKLEVNHS